jgi:hypothetical protein
VRRAVAVLAASVLAAGLWACGGDEGSEEEAAPEVAMERLQDDGYATGEIITDGANVGVARNGKLDADAYLGVDADPEGNVLYAGIYFFETEEDAAVLAKEWEPKPGDDTYSEQVGTRVYNIAGTQAELVPVIASAEAE